MLHNFLSLHQLSFKHCLICVICVFAGRQDSNKSLNNFVLFLDIAADRHGARRMETYQAYEVFSFSTPLNFQHTWFLTLKLLFEQSTCLKMFQLDLILHIHRTVSIPLFKRCNETFHWQSRNASIQLINAESSSLHDGSSYGTSILLSITYSSLQF